MWGPSSPVAPVDAPPGRQYAAALPWTRWGLQRHPLDAMPHPKRRTSKPRKGIRRSHLGTTPEALQRDPRSGALTRPHRINEKESTHYGFKKGGQEGFQVFEREDF